MKQCRSCGVEKLLSEYYTSPSGTTETECYECLSARNREKKYRARYGITVQDYDDLYESQQGCCAICSAHQSTLQKRLAVDHNHDTGEIRGLLCFDCNSGIGKLNDDYFRLLKAAEYLRSFER